MKTIYAVHSFCRSDRLPAKGTIERIVFDNKYFFTGYSDNVLYVRKYMDFIDALFNNTFRKLHYDIVQYYYPDTIEYTSGNMLDYIESHYYNTRLFREQVIRRISTKIPYTNNDVDLYLTDLLYYGEQLDYISLGEEMVDEDGFEFVRNIFLYVQYNDDTRGIFDFLERVETIIDEVHVDNRICTDLYAVYELYIQVIRRLPLERRVAFWNE